MRLLDHDVFSGITTLFDYDPLNDVSTIKTVQDVDPILERNKSLKNDNDYEAKGKKEGWRHLAGIPNIVIQKWKLEKGVDVFNKDHMPAVLKLLNDPDWSHLKTTYKVHLGTKREF
jgi:hypothetical protein